MKLEAKEEAAAAIVPLACFVFVTGPIIEVRWCFVTDNSQRTIVGACGLNTLQKLLQNWGRRKRMSLSVKMLQQQKRGRKRYATSTEPLRTTRHDLMVMQYYLNCLMIGVLWHEAQISDVLTVDLFQGFNPPKFPNSPSFFFLILLFFWHCC